MKKILNKKETYLIFISAIFLFLITSTATVNAATLKTFTIIAIPNEIQRSYSLGDISPEIKIAKQILNLTKCTVPPIGQETEHFDGATYGAVTCYEREKQLPLSGNISPNLFILLKQEYIHNIQKIIRDIERQIRGKSQSSDDREYYGKLQKIITQEKNTIQTIEQEKRKLSTILEEFLDKEKGQRKYTDFLKELKDKEKDLEKQVEHIDKQLKRVSAGKKKLSSITVNDPLVQRRFDKLDEKVETARNASPFDDPNYIRASGNAIGRGDAGTRRAFSRALYDIQKAENDAITQRSQAITDYRKGLAEAQAEARKERLQWELTLGEKRHGSEKRIEDIKKILKIQTKLIENSQKKIEILENLTQIPPIAESNQQSPEQKRLLQRLETLQQTGKQLSAQYNLMLGTS